PFVGLAAAPFTCVAIENSSLLPSHFAPLVARERADRFFLQVEIDVVADVERDAEDRAVRERARCLVLLAHAVLAVRAPAQTVARQCEVSALCAHRSFGDDSVVDVEL